jgi:PAS domain S-box-containing protein
MDSRPTLSLEELQAHLIAIVESSDDAIIGKDAEGIITSWNKGAERLYGYTAAEAVGRPITLIMPPDLPDEFPGIMRRLLAGERIDHYETVRVRQDGRRLNVSVTISPIRDVTGRVTGASAIARDISERTRLEAERAALLEREQEARRIAEEANRAKDEFLSTLSHELRTPLTPLLAWTAMLRSGRVDATKVQYGLDVLDRSARALARLVDDLLDVSRIVAGRFRIEVASVDLARVVAAAVATVEPTATARRIELTTRADPRTGPVLGDANRLQQAVWNLLANAVKFTPVGGHVDVIIEQAEGRACILVRDTGAGIAPDVLPVIFERFRQGDASSTRAFGGLGLGLAIVRSIVELHGGRVMAESAGEGQGATFTITLPLAPAGTGSPAAVDAPAVSPRSGSPSLAGRSILVVEDDADTRELLRTVLEGTGARVSSVASAREALAAVARATPDLLVSDIGMPEDDGYALIRALRARGCTVPAVALTAYAGPTDRDLALEAGFQRHVPKPVEQAELIGVLTDLLHDAGRAPS